MVTERSTVAKVLFGRALEGARLAVLVEQAQHGAAASLVIHGQPGVGKPALLGELAESVSGACVLRTQGLEAESPFAFEYGTAPAPAA